MNSSTPPAIVGDLFLGNAATTSGGACAIPPDSCKPISGSVFTNQDAFLGTSGPSGNTNPSLASGVVKQAMQATADFNALGVAETIAGDITTSQTLSCTALQLVGNKCVVLVNGNIQLGNNNILTLNGINPDESFILEVNGTVTLNGGNYFSGGQIRLSGTLTSPDDAVIDVKNVSSGDTLPNAFIQGILLDLQGGVGFAPGMVLGEIIGGGNEIRLVSGSQVLGPSGTSTPTVPEPTSLPLLGSGIGLAVQRLRRRQR